MKTDFILRPAAISDMWDIYELANSQDVRLVSFSHDPISRDVHKKWYLDKLNDKKCHIFIITNISHQFIGSVRFDLTSSNLYTVSILITKQFRGIGLGPKVIQECSRNILNKHPPRYHIKAMILEGNIASLKSFLKAGYHEIGQTTSENNKSIELVFP
ncbi:MAG: GCN5-like protein N-acetyltransferase [uncultured bacterium]|nr:MAG: GCN5-like protein N-acetyltransferase [uncultured bacterium]